MLTRASFEDIHQRFASIWVSLPVQNISSIFAFLSVGVVAFTISVISTVTIFASWVFLTCCMVSSPFCFVVVVVSSIL